MSVDLSGFVDLSEEQLDNLSNVSDADIEKAKLLWKQNVSEEFGDLLDAETVEELDA